MSSLQVRAAVSSALIIHAGAAMWAAPTLRVIEAKLCALLMHVVAKDATYVTVRDEPGIAYQMNDSWLALPATVHLTGVFAAAGLLFIAAAAMWMPQLALLRKASPLRMLIAAVVSLLGAVIVFQLRFMMLAGIWASNGIAAFHGASVWLTVVTYAVTGLVALASYFLLVVRPALRDSSHRADG